MSNMKQLNLVILLAILVVGDRIGLTQGQQEEKFFYHADFASSPREESASSDAQAAESQLSPFPDGPLHVSLGLRALSGDNRPQFVEPIGAAASIQAQVRQ